MELHNEYTGYFAFLLTNLNISFLIIRLIIKFYTLFEQNYKDNKNLFFLFRRILFLIFRFVPVFRKVK